MITRTLKPWGSEELIVDHPYVVKSITMLPGMRCSLQKHVHKHETIFVHSGRLMIQISNRKDVYTPGMTCVIPAGTVHRMGVSAVDEEPAIYIECSTPHLDDVIRLEDDYGRH